ncbi:unnamed protein product, partial [Callosobruchus maculatus]
VHSATLGKRQSSIVEYLTNQLRTLNFIIVKISYVQEDELIIIKLLEEFVKECDITIAVSTDLKYSVLQALVKICGEESLNRKKSHIYNDYRSEWWNALNWPAAVKLLLEGSLSLPVLYFQRIYMLKEAFVEDQYTKVVEDHLRVYSQKPNYSKVLKIKHQMNNSIQTIVQQLKTKFQTAISTYLMQIDYHIIEIRMESTSFENIVEFEVKLKMQLSSLDSNLDIEEYQLDDLSIKIYQSKEAHIRQAIDNIEECIRRYGPENIFLSFNGGKDCTVLLHLYNIVLKLKYPDFKGKIFCSYVKTSNIFPEQTKFIEYCKVYFNLQIEESTRPMKEHLEHILNIRPNLKACLMGTRRTDPYSAHLEIFEFTDPDWPRIMRVSPLMEWHYSDIWDYLLYYKVPYCKLYDYGYTSLGDVTNTVRNPALSYLDKKTGSTMYLPAYKLMDESKERIGRNIVV